MLVDTAVWVDHLRHGDEALVALMEQSVVTVHPFVIGEIACGHLRDRAEVLRALESLPKVSVVDHADAMNFVDEHGLMGSGLGWVDVHLLASASASSECIWTRDSRLHQVATRLELARPDTQD